MKKETKVVISSDNVVVDFNPNNADHEEALKKANVDSISSKVEFQRKLAYFEDLMRKVTQSRHGVPWDMSKEIDNFTKATGIELSVAQLIKACDYSLEGKLEVYLKDILASKQTSVVGLKVGDTIKSWDGADIPIVAIHTHCPKSLFKTFEHRINTRNDFSVGIPDRLEIVWPQDRFNADFPAIREAINSLKTVLSENGYIDVRRGLVKALNNTYGLKATVQDFVNLIEGSCSPIDFVLKTQYNTPLLQAKAGEDKSSTLMVTDSDGMVCFRKPDRLLLGDKIMSFARHSPRPDKKESRNEQPTGRLKHSSRYWYDRFDRPHLLESGEPMSASFIKCEPGYGKYLDLSVNKGPIPSPDPRDESVRSKDTVIQNSVSISPGKVNIEVLEAACRTMAESMKAMHRKTISKECYDKLINELEFIFGEFTHVKERLARIHLYGELLSDEKFKQKYGVVFSADEWNAFLNAKLSSVELVEKYVKLEEKKTLTRKEFDECLNALKAILQLVGPSGISRKDVESVEPLRDLLNGRFGLNISRHDFLNQIYRRQSSSSFLKHYAHVENS